MSLSFHLVREKSITSEMGILEEASINPSISVHDDIGVF